MPQLWKENNRYGFILVIFSIKVNLHFNKQKFSQSQDGHDIYENCIFIWPVFMLLLLFRDVYNHLKADGFCFGLCF